MPIKHAIWTVSDKPAPLTLIKLTTERRLEDMILAEWLDTVSESQAVNEVGLFGNQNSVCKPTTPKWRHTVDRLKQRFPNWSK